MDLTKAWVLNVSYITYNKEWLYWCIFPRIFVCALFADKAMQLNQAKFRENGNCGFLLKPEFMFREDFDPYDKNTLVGVEPLTLSIRVIGARHLSRSGRGTSSPSVEIEVVGAEYDSGSKLMTKTVCKWCYSWFFGRQKMFSVINLFIQKLNWRWLLSDML